MFLLEPRLKKEYNYTVLPLYAFMVYYMVNFTFRGSVNPLHGELGTHACYGVNSWYTCYTLRTSLAYMLCN